MRSNDTLLQETLILESDKDGFIESTDTIGYLVAFKNNNYHPAILSFPPAINEIPVMGQITIPAPIEFEGGNDSSLLIVTGGIHLYNNLSDAEGLLEQLANGVNETINLPKGLQLVILECHIPAGSKLWSGVRLTGEDTWYGDSICSDTVFVDKIIEYGLI